MILREIVPEKRVTSEEVCTVHVRSVVHSARARDADVFSAVQPFVSIQPSLADTRQPVDCEVSCYSWAQQRRFSFQCICRRDYNTESVLSTPADNQKAPCLGRGQVSRGRWCCIWCRIPD